MESKFRRKRVVICFIGTLAIFSVAMSGGEVYSTISPNHSSNVLQVEGIISRDVSTASLPDDHIGDQLEFNHLSIEQGLSQNSVLSIIQDSKGFMWFGTLNGLNRFDGYEFTIYQSNPDDPFSLKDSAISSLLEDHNGNLWVGTGNGGLSRLDRQSEKFANYTHDSFDPNSLSSNNVLSLAEDRSGWIWVGTDGGGLNRFDPRTGRFTRYQNDPLDSQSLSSNIILSIYQDRAGVLWFGTGGGGLSRLVPSRVSGNQSRPGIIDGHLPEDVASWQSEHFIHFRHEEGNSSSLSHNDVYSIYQDRSGTLWIGTGDGSLNKFDPQTGRFTRYPLDPGDLITPYRNPIRSIREDFWGKLWVGMDHEGLYRFDPINGDFQHFAFNPREPHSLSNNHIRSVYIDRNYILWVGTNGGGINQHYLLRKDFKHYLSDPTNFNSLNDNEVSAIIEDHTGSLWIGTYGNGLNRFDREQNQFTHYIHRSDDPYSLSSNTVLSIHEDRSGSLWIGTGGGGLNRFDQQTGEFTHYLNNPNVSNSLSDNTVNQIYEDIMGYLWIGTETGGLNRFNPVVETFTQYQHDPENPYSLSSNAVRSIYSDSQGFLWVGTDKGLNKYNAKTGRFIRYIHDPNDPRSLGNDTILALYEDRQEILWIGTNGGLDRFDRLKEIFKHYGTENGLIDPVIYGILEDDQGDIWLSTNKGLSRLDSRRESFRNYDSSDGLPSSGFYGSAHYKNQAGELFFGGLEGFVSFLPERIMDDPSIPPLVLTSLSQGGEKIPVDQPVGTLPQVTLSWPNHFFEFEVAALSYVEPEKNQYAYLLEGYDEAWNFAGSTRSGRYANIPEGIYTLRIRGSNHDGTWNEEGVSLKVQVLPPLWGTAWFKALLGLIVLGSVVGGYRLRVNRMLARNQELENLVHQRTYEVERRRRVAEGLAEIMELLNSNKSLEDVLNLIVFRAAQLTGGWRAIVCRCHDCQSAEILATFPSDKDRYSKIFSDGESLGEWLSIILMGKQVVIWPEWGERQETTVPDLPIEFAGVETVLCIPISIQEEVYGGLVLFYCENRTFSNEDMELVMLLTEQAALAIGNAQLREQLQEMAISTERNRLARDLHDAVTQTLFSASLIAEALPDLWHADHQEGYQLLEELRKLNRGALAEMRSLLLELRPESLNQVELVELLRQLAETVTGRTGIPVELEYEGDHNLPSNVRVGFYRIAQEAMNNAERHSHANRIFVRLQSCNRREDGKLDEVILQIDDNGCGFNPDRVPADHFGITIMHERAEAIGATLSIWSQPGSGTRIRLKWRA